MLVDQLAISIFGLVLALAALAVSNGIFSIVVSAFAILFYLFLIYTMLWEVGAKDRISVDVGKKPYRPHTGLLISLVANIPNLLIALLYSIAYPFMGAHKWAGNMNAIINVISALIEGMYRGLLVTIHQPSGGEPILNMWWTYFVIVIPALITAWIAYFAGFKNFRMFAQYFNKKQNSDK